MTDELAVNATYDATGNEIEPWQRHRWDSRHELCVECTQIWPCDIAKAINFGIAMGQMRERYSRA